MIEVPPFSRLSEEADWAEISCLVEKKSYIPFSEIETALEAADVGDDEAETTIENIRREIDSRHLTAPGAHPVRIIENRLERVMSWRAAFSYTFMLLLTCQSFYPYTRIRKRDWPQTAKLFEHLTTKAVERYVNHAINIGSPREVGVPKRFIDCLDFVSDALKESRGPVSVFRRWAKDEDVDIIAWLPFDQRNSQVILLIQCAAGEDWQDKLDSISLPVWQDYIDFAVKPTRAFALPRVFNPADWTYFSKRGGILLDRLRISSLAPKNPDLRTKLCGWCEGQLKRLRSG